MNLTYLIATDRSLEIKQALGCVLAVAVILSLMTGLPPTKFCDAHFDKNERFAEHVARNLRMST